MDSVSLEFLIGQIEFSSDSAPGKKNAQTFLDNINKYVNSLEEQNKKTESVGFEPIIEYSFYENLWNAYGIGGPETEEEKFLDEKGIGIADLLIHTGKSGESGEITNIVELFMMENKNFMLALYQYESWSGGGSADIQPRGSKKKMKGKAYIDKNTINRAVEKIRGFLDR